MQKLKAFTLVELIVVITILAILGTIAFISFQGYSTEARDSKRISDVRSLLNKINIENVKGVDFQELIIETTESSGQILGIVDSEYNTMGKANFDILKENGNRFKDPSNDSIDYPLAYFVEGEHSFSQIATINEKENKTVIFGNYYTTHDNDIKSLFENNGKIYENNSEKIYDENTGYFCVGNCSSITECGNANGTLITGKPSGENACKVGSLVEKSFYSTYDGEKTIQTWVCKAENGSTQKCSAYYSPISSLDDCIAPGVIGIEAGKYFMSPTGGGNQCDEENILVCTGVGEGLTLAGCNATGGISLTKDGRDYYNHPEALVMCPGEVGSGQWRLGEKEDWVNLINVIGWTNITPAQYPFNIGIYSRFSSGVWNDEGLGFYWTSTIDDVTGGAENFRVISSKGYFRTINSRTKYHDSVRCLHD